MGGMTASDRQEKKPLQLRARVRRVWERSELSVGPNGPSARCGRVSAASELANLVPEPKISHKKKKKKAGAATDCSAGLRSASWAVPDSAPPFVSPFWRRRWGNGDLITANGERFQRFRLERQGREEAAGWRGIPRYQIFLRASQRL